MAKYATLPMLALFFTPNLAPAQEKPSFEVASVKLNQSPSRTPVKFGPDSVTLTSVDLRIALILAYGLRDFQMVGPDWLRDSTGAQHFNVSAKAAHPAPETQLRAMLQTLLAERFHISLHWDKRQMPVVALRTTRAKAKLQQSAAEIELDTQWLGFTNIRHQPAPGPNGRVGHSFTNAPMAALAAALSAGMGDGVEPVVDMTGLPGRYDFTYFDPLRPPAGEPPPSPDERLATYKAIVQENLGLTLERRKAPVDILVIDHADKAPTEN